MPLGGRITTSWIELILQIARVINNIKTHSREITGLEIATDTVANATNIFSWATKNSSLVTKVATRYLYDLDLN